MDGIHLNSTVTGELHRALLLSMRVRAEDELGSLPPPEFFVAHFPAHLYTKQLLVSFFTWVLYENVITIGESVELFWKQRWNLSKILFLLNRYVGIFAVLTNLLQSFVYRPSPLLSHFAMAGPSLESRDVTVISLAMLLRVIALWSRSQLIKTIVICLFLFNTSFYLIASFYSYVKKGGGIPQPVSPFTGCIPQPDGRIPLYSIFIMALVFETAVVFFTVLKSYHLSLLLRTPAVGGNEQRQPGHQLTDTGAFRLSNVLFNDGILYYVAVILSHTLSLYASATPIESNPTVSIPIVTAAPAIAATTVACNRLFLRLHDVILTRKSWEDTYGVADGNGDNAGVVSARVTVFAPMDFPLGGGNRNGAHAHLRDSVETTDDVQFSSQFGTVDYDYHDYLREDLKVKKARRLTASGSRHQATTIGSTMRLNGMEMNNFGDGGGKRDMTGEIGSA